MKAIFTAFLLIVSCRAFAIDTQRTMVDSVDNLKLDTFVYLPADLSNAKGIVLSIGGSGVTKAGHGGPSRFSKIFAERGFIGIEWNKRGILTSPAIDSTTIDFSIYNSATIENIFIDASRVLEFAIKSYPGIPVFVVGGSEGSVTTTLLAEYFGNQIRAVATFGNVVMPFVQTSSMQITDLFLKDAWSKIDENGDDTVSEAELKNYKPLDQEYSFLPNAKFQSIDLSNDGSVTRDEMSAFVVNYFVNEHPNENFWYESSGVANRYLESMFRLAPLTVRAYNISIPVFMAQGEIDWNTPAKNVYEFQIQCKATKKTNFTFKYYPNVGHAPSPEMLEDFISYFLSFTERSNPILNPIH